MGHGVQLQPGFAYFESKPIEIFRVPDVSQPLSACAALLAFAAYPSEGQRAFRQKAGDAYLAWIIRMARQEGIKIKPPARLTRRHLPPKGMRDRAYTASRRFEDDGLSLVGMAMDMTFFRSGGPAELGFLFGGYLGGKERVGDCSKGYRYRRQLLSIAPPTPKITTGVGTRAYV